MLIPQLTPDGASDAAVSVPPPARFRPLLGPPSRVRWRTSIEHPSAGLTDAQKAGLRYEAKAQLWLRLVLGHAYHTAPTLRFREGVSELERTVIPDGIHFDIGGRATIFEIKSQHMPEAWWQLRQLYEPVVSALSFINRVSCVEVTRSYDPSMGFPEEVVLCRDIQSLLKAPSAPFKVLLWKP